MRPIAAVLCLIIPATSSAFPEMIRHGYTSCVACHVSPAGGGLLTAYGRTIASEVLSRWSYTGEETLLHGALSEKSRSWVDGSRETGFNIGGGFRFLQTRVENEKFRQGRFIPMQRDFEAAARIGQFSVVSSYGLYYSATEPDTFKGRKSYALWNLNENFSLRGGKFLPAYGIMVSDHYLSIKQGLRLGLGSERNTIESQLIFDHWSGNLSVSDATSELGLLNEKSATVGLNLNLGETNRVGINYWLGSYKGGRRDITGFNALLGFSKRFYSLSEFDLLVDVPDGAIRKRGVSFFEKLGWEATRGLHLIAQIDGSQTDLGSTATKFVSPGIGITFYPRPHFELQLMWSRPKIAKQDASDSAFFMFHYYL